MQQERQGETAGKRGARRGLLSLRAAWRGVGTTRVTGWRHERRGARRPGSWALGWRGERPGVGDGGDGGDGAAEVLSELVLGWKLDDASADPELLEALVRLAEDHDEGGERALEHRASAGEISVDFRNFEHFSFE